LIDVVSERQMTGEASQQGSEAHCDEGSGRPAHTGKTVSTVEL